MKILPLSLLCLCLPCGLSRGDQPPDGSPVRFQISMDQAAEHKAPEPDPVPDQSTPFNAAKLLLRALQEKTDWKNEPYKSLPATSPFVGQLKLKSILSRMEAVQAYVTGAAPERPLLWMKPPSSPRETWRWPTSCCRTRQTRTSMQPLRWPW